MMRYLLRWFGLSFLFVIQLSASEQIIKGRVLDINTHREIESVNLYVEHTSIGTSTDFTGRFILTIPKPKEDMVIIFNHIGYNPLSIPLKELKDKVYLSPRIIPLQGISVEGQKEALEIERDLPQAVTSISYETFEIRGFTDAGDLLETDRSIQVDEDLSGEKTVAMRGGNADEVLVLYNGIELNSTFDNQFDFSLIDLEDVQRVEVIKGSHTVMYGSGALSGIVNIVPRMQQDYHVRFQQKIGTYQSGSWGLHLYQPLGRVHTSYSYQAGGWQRNFEGSTGSDNALVNETEHHNAGVWLDLSSDNDPRNRTLGLTFLRTRFDYDNRRDWETVENINQITSLQYEGPLFWLPSVKMSTSLRKLDEDQSLYMYQTQVDRNMEDESVHVHAESGWDVGPVSIMGVYQLQHSKMNFFDDRPVSAYGSDTRDVEWERQEQGVASVVKYHGPTGSNSQSTMDLDVSVRHDDVKDEDVSGAYPSNSWKRNTYKFASHLNGINENTIYDLFINLGTNVRFPTFFQQMNQYVGLSLEEGLEPEKNISQEIGIDFTRKIHGSNGEYGLQLKGSLFKMQYDNKLRSFYTPGSPIAFFDNVQDATISGYEISVSFLLMQKKVIITPGYAHYNPSDRLAFPFKSEMKATLDLSIDHLGYSFLLHLFKEGDQIGWIRYPAGGMEELTLPGYTNLDLHLSKEFHVYKMKLIGNISARNLLNSDVELVGLAIRDRRLYLTMGLEI